MLRYRNSLRNNYIRGITVVLCTLYDFLRPYTFASVAYRYWQQTSLTVSYTCVGLSIILYTTYASICVCVWFLDEETNSSENECYNFQYFKHLGLYSSSTLFCSGSEFHILNYRPVSYSHQFIFQIHFLDSSFLHAVDIMISSNTVCSVPFCQPSQARHNDGTPGCRSVAPGAAWKRAPRGQNIIFIYTLGQLCKDRMTRVIYCTIIYQRVLK